ncbi:MAG: glycosyltransferase [Bacteroidales bacterium]|nr:glycosyltransferase [Bacteroidales bacterium]
MVIFHVISHLAVGGAERVAINIAKSRTPGFEYHVVEVSRGTGSFSDQLEQELISCGVNVHHALFKSNKLSIVLFPFWFLFTVLRYKPDVVHTHTEVPDIAVFLWNRLFGWTLPGLRYVRTIHNTVLWTSWEKLGAIAEHFFITNGANVAIGPSVRKSYVEKYHASAPIVFNGVEQASQKPFDGIECGKTNILFAGRLEYQKGVDELCRVVKALSDDESIVFHIVGKGSLSHRVEELWGMKNVRIYDMIYGLSSYLSSFDYLFMPSNFEGLSLMSIEASMCKLPAIINKCDGLSETLPPDWPLFVVGNDVEDYLKIFKNLSSYDRVKLAESAYLYAAEHFSIKVMQRGYEAMYQTKVSIDGI